MLIVLQYIQNYTSFSPIMFFLVKYPTYLCSTRPVQHGSPIHKAVLPGRVARPCNTGRVTRLCELGFSCSRCVHPTARVATVGLLLAADHHHILQQ